MKLLLGCWKYFWTGYFVAVTAALTTLLPLPSWGSDDKPVAVRPRLETPPLFDDEKGGNADGDDPAIWVNPLNSGESLVIVTKKDAGLSVYDLSGQSLQDIPAPPAPSANDRAGRFNNVDVLYNFRLGNRSVDLAVVSDRGSDRVRIYSISGSDATARKPLTDITDSSVPFVFSANQNQVNEQATAYGLAIYRDRRSGRAYAYVSQRNRTKIAKLELLDAGNGRVGYKKLEEIALPNSFPLPNKTTWTPCTEPGEDPQVEGMVVDWEKGQLYAAQEDVGIWKIDANKAQPILVDRVREYGVPYTYDDQTEECNINFDKDPGFGGQYLSSDVEGLTIYYGAGDKGYLLASSQGDDTFAVYTRSDNRYVGSFALVDAPKRNADSVQESDGAAVINVPLGNAFEFGLLVTHDGDNTPQVLDESGEVRPNTNFKFTSWSSVARAFPEPLLVDPVSWNPRY
jgi:3-phytase